MAAIELLCDVTGFKMLTPTVFELCFDSQTQFEFKAGQFISIVIPGAGPKGRDLRRAYSIASAPHVRPVELCVKLVEGGPGTNYLYTLRPGDRFRGFAPYGDFVYKTHHEKHACFISTGTGIAPFRSMVFDPKFIAQAPQSTTCLFGVREESELMYVDEMTGHPHVEFVATVSRPSAHWNGFKGRVTDYLRTLDSAFPWVDSEYYLCGGGAMIDEVKAILAEKQVPKTSIHQEVYYK